MRKITLILATVLAITVSSTASATLFDRGSGLIYDDVLDVTWLQNANLANQSFNWQGAVDWAANLVFGGFSDWRLASMDVDGDTTVVNCSSATEVACRDNELGYMYWQNLGGTGNNLTGNQTVGGVTLNNIQPVYWSGTEFATDPRFAWTFSFFNSGQGGFSKGRTDSAWAVRPGDVFEPSTLMFLGIGLVGLGWVGRRRRAS